MSKTAILIGFGGMGRRYHQALKLMRIKVIASVIRKLIKKIKIILRKKQFLQLIIEHYQVLKQTYFAWHLILNLD